MVRWLIFVVDFQRVAKAVKTINPGNMILAPGKSLRLMIDPPIFNLADRSA
jgi:hypothetical protein